MKALVLTPPFLEPYRPPISGAIIAEVARLSGYEVSAIDLAIEFYHHVGATKYENMTQQFMGFIPIAEDNDDIINPFIDAQLSDSVLSDVDMILISIHTKFEQEFSYRVLKRIRDRTKAKIVLGGSGVKVHRFIIDRDLEFGQAMLDQGLADHMVEGEGEVALKELLAGNLDYPGIDGRKPQQIDDIESLPLPNYGFYDIDKYVYLPGKGKEVFIYGSRGCVRDCTFCDVAHFWPKFRYRSGQSIAGEMISNYEKHGITAFYFTDSLFNGNLKAFRDWLTIITKYPHKVNWNWGGFAIIRGKQQHPPEIYDMCREAGHSNWVTGLEHPVQRLRFAMRKPITNEDVEYHFEQSERANISNTLLMLPYWPDETMEEHLEYQRMFTKWRRYVASGSIAAINIASSLSLFEETPMSKDRQYDWKISQDALRVLGSSATQNFWVNPDNPELTVKNKIQRTLNIYKEAIDKKWPIIATPSKLSELKYLAKALVDNPDLNSLEQLIPIKT